MLVRAPGSSANLGSGFDALALAVDLPFEASDRPLDGLHEATSGHPVVRASVEAGGPARLWWRSAIPSGRGLGFSGAARVAGAYLALRLAEADPTQARAGAFVTAASLEGHGDNAAASAFGGVVATAAGRVVPVGFTLDARIVAWSPSSSTSTDASRGRLPVEVPFADAVSNVGHAVLLVAALAVGDWAAMAVAVGDRLHQPTRLAAAPASAAVLERLRTVGPGVAWLSGSGPTVAALVPTALVDEAVAAAGAAASDPDGDPVGTVRVLEVDRAGVVELAST